MRISRRRHRGPRRPRRNPAALLITAVAAGMMLDLALLSPCCPALAFGVLPACPDDMQCSVDLQCGAGSCAPIACCPTDEPAPDDMQERPPIPGWCLLLCIDCCTLPIHTSTMGLSPDHFPAVSVLAPVLQSMITIAATRRMPLPPSRGSPARPKQPLLCIWRN